MNKPVQPLSLPIGSLRGASSSYRKGQEIEISLDKEGEFYRSLRVKSQKIEAWWEERGRHYLGRYRFIGLTLTFRDEKAYEDFERAGGRRAFMKNYRRLCQRKFGKDVIVDFVCVAEFQERGVVHFHYLIVSEFGYRLPYPDKEIFRWGYTNLVVLNAGNTRKYLSSYVRKLRQLSYEAYQRWKEKFGRFRLYDFSRKLENGILSLLSRGWGRVLYWRALRGVDWNFRGGVLYVRYRDVLCGIKAKWDFLFLGGCVRLRFLGFKIVVSDGFSFEIDSLDELIEFVQELKT